MFEPASSAAPSCATTGAASGFSRSSNTAATGPTNIATSTRAATAGGFGMSVP